MEPTLISNLVSLGIGGAIAALVMFWKRADDKAYQLALTTTSASIQALAENLTARMMLALEGNTKALLAATQAVDALCSLQRVDSRLDNIERVLRRRPALAQDAHAVQGGSTRE